MQSEELRLKAGIAALLQLAEAADGPGPPSQKEDAQHGADRTGEELPDELARRETRLATIQAAKIRPETRQREANKAAGREPGGGAPKAGKRGPPFKRPFGEPPAKPNRTSPIRTAESCALDGSIHGLKIAQVTGHRDQTQVGSLRC